MQCAHKVYYNYSQVKCEAGQHGWKITAGTVGTAGKPGRSTEQRYIYKNASYCKWSGSISILFVSLVNTLMSRPLEALLLCVQWPVDTWWCVPGGSLGRRTGWGWSQALEEKIRVERRVWRRHRTDTEGTLCEDFSGCTYFSVSPAAWGPCLCISVLSPDTQPAWNAWLSPKIQKVVIFKGKRLEGLERQN